MQTLDGEQFLFLPKLREKLQWLVDNPKQIPSPLCFYGQPGIGKTQFAKYLGSQVALSTVHYDMNAYKANGESSGKLLADIKRLGKNLCRFVDGTEDKYWEHAIILDEWHNANAQQQDAYKIVFEDLPKTNRILFILCLNTTSERGVGNILTPAIRSRCHPISFDTTEKDKAALTSLVSKRFPHLRQRTIELYLPDLRRLSREAKLLEAMNLQNTVH